MFRVEVRETNQRDRLIIHRVDAIHYRDVRRPASADRIQFDVLARFECIDPVNFRVAENDVHTFRPRFARNRVEFRRELVQRDGVD